MTKSIQLLKKYKHLVALSLIAILSFTLNFYAISKIGYGNAYYAAAIKSMSESFHNFFFVSFDPAGIVTVDKPPLALWIQTIFVLIFGYHGWAMLLPQALSGTGACIMLYILTAKHFGRAAGLTSSLVLALTPAVVVASRNNTMDMQLVLCLLVVTWFLFSAIEKGKKSHLFLAALFIGVGFNIKMLEAYMILPAVVIVYLVFSKEKFIRRIINSLICFVIIVVVSFAWVVIVDLTPAAQRPYIGSSTNNTVMELILGHNGMERVVGNSKASKKSVGNTFGNTNANQSHGGNQGQGQSSGKPQQGSNQQRGNQSIRGNQQRGNQGTQGNIQNGNTWGGQNAGNNSPITSRIGGGGPQGGAGNDIGTAGVFRLWSNTLYGQVSWLILLAIFCIVVKIRKFSLKNVSIKQGITVFWTIWLVTMYLFFSFAGFWHRYYLCLFAPALGGLIGPGIVDMYRRFRNRTGIKQFLLPVAFVITVVPEIIYVCEYSELRNWLVPLISITGIVALTCMGLYYFNARIRGKCKNDHEILKVATVLMLVSLLAGPFYWSLTVVIYPCQNSTMPYAGPELSNTQEVKGMTPDQENLTKADSRTLALENYLVAHYKKGSFLVVSQRADDVAQFIVDTGLPAVAYGGFLGSDNAMTLDQLKEFVKEGKVTYFMMTNQMGNSGGSELANYVKENATLINPSEYGGVSNGDRSETGSQSMGTALYEFTIN